MKKNEQQLADELDAILNAHQAGQPLPDADALPPEEAALAAELMALAADTEPEPAFLAELEADLARAASRQAASAEKQDGQPSWGASLLAELKHLFTGKRTVYALGAVAAILLVAVLAWPMLQNLGGGVVPTRMPVAELPAAEGVTEEAETAAPTTTAPTAVPPTVTSETEPEAAEPEAAAIAELPLLPPPAAEAAPAGPALGLGSGGGGAQGPTPPGATTMPAFTDIFSGTEFVLNAPLPETPATAEVQQFTYDLVTEGDARRIADLFGFDGPLYTPVAPENAAAPAQGFATYLAFDGPRTLNVHGSGASYVDASVTVDYRQPLPDAEAQAEAFLLARGLLDFPYELSSGATAGEVYVSRLVNGRPVSQPEFFVQVGVDGRIAFASSFQMLSQVAVLGEYPLRPAADAWALIQDGVVANNIPYTLLPDFSALTPPAPPPGEQPQRPQTWQRQYEPGAEIHVYTTPVVYEPVAGDGPPRIDLGEYDLVADDAELRAMAAEVGQTVHIWGELGADGRTITLAGWEPLPQHQPLFIEGTTQREGDAVRVVSEGGETYLLPDAPADLPADLPVFVFAWEARDVGAAFPALDWQNIEERVELGPPEPVPVEPITAVPDPYRFDTVTVNAVTLTYYYMPLPTAEEDDPAPPSPQTPPALLQPVWQFSGVTDNGDAIMLYAPAVAPAYLEATAETP